MKRKICCVVTARPSYARIRTALAAIKAHPDLELQLVVSASALLDRYGNAARVIESEGFHIDRRVYMVIEGENLATSAKSTGIGLSELATVFDDLKPDAVITIADRFETGLILRQPRAADVTTVRDSVLAILSRDAFEVDLELQLEVQKLVSKYLHQFLQQDRLHLK